MHRWSRRQNRCPSKEAPRQKKPPLKPEEALSYLGSGDFNKAKALYSLLLDKNPEEELWIAGYFVASFWDNRIDHIHSSREGKDRGILLLRYFSQFEDEITKRNWDSFAPFARASRCIVEETAHHLKLAYQWEGANALDSEMLGDFATCLVKIEDYKTAIEILQYAQDRHRFPARLKFALAESLVSTGKEEGKYLYYSCFMESAESFQPSLVKWEPLLEAIQIAKETGSDWKEFLPNVLFQNKIVYPKSSLQKPEVEALSKELVRLYESKHLGMSFKWKCHIQKVAIGLLQFGKNAARKEIVLLAEKVLGEI